jgi:rRNA maturation endonuclease Nob1
LNNDSTVLILDSSAFINLKELLQLDYSFYSVYGLESELKSSDAKLIYDLALLNDRLKLITPSEKSVKYIEEISKKTGDFQELSEIDILIIALSWEIKNEKRYIPVVLTEDYSIQNVLTILKIKFKSIIEKGISNLIIWENFCPHCGKVYNTDPTLKKCPICEIKLKKRPKEIKEIKNGK